MWVTRHRTSPGMYKSGALTSYRGATGSSGLYWSDQSWQATQNTHQINMRSKNFDKSRITFPLVTPAVGESILKPCCCRDALSHIYKSAAPCYCSICHLHSLMHFNWLENPENCICPRGIWAPTWHMVPRANPSLNPKLHDDRVSHLFTAQHRLYFTIGRDMSPKNCPFLWGSRPQKLIYDTLGPPNSTCHLHWFSRFSRTCSCVQQT